VDEILNALLFVLIGLEVLVLTFTRSFFISGLIAIPLVLLARWLSVSGPVVILKHWRKFTPGAVRIMTWGGLRGGISVALALSLPPSREREIILAVTYIIVVFSIVFQGLTLKPLVKRLMAK
jgi:monovalent cation:H+ antiporter, CPA1 family